MVLLVDLEGHGTAGEELSKGELHAQFDYIQRSMMV